MDFTALQSELTSDPLSLGYAAFIESGNDQGLANLLNQDPSTFSPAKTWTYSQPYVPMADVLIWAANSGALAALTTGTSNTNAAIAAACDAALRLFTLPSITTFNPLGANESALLASLVSASVLTSAQVTALQALTSVPATRAQVLFGVPVGINDISKALRGN